MKHTKSGKKFNRWGILIDGNLWEETHYQFQKYPLLKRTRKQIRKWRSDYFANEGKIVKVLEICGYGLNTVEVVE